MTKQLKLHGGALHALELLDEGVHIHKVAEYAGVYPWVYRLEQDDTSDRYDLSGTTISWLLMYKLVSAEPYTNPNDRRNYLKLELTDAGRTALRSAAAAPDTNESEA